MSSEFRSNLKDKRAARAGKRDIIRQHGCVWGTITKDSGPLFVYTCSKPCTIRDLHLLAPGVDDKWVVNLLMFEGGDLVKNDQQTLKESQVWSLVDIKRNQKISILMLYKGDLEIPKPLVCTVDYFLDIENG
jgi:hypothetical protein